MKSVLYISYDGLLDPLGGSQILPYVKGISAHPRPVHILSFEKFIRFRDGRDRLNSELIKSGIAWSPLLFSQRLGILGKIWDLIKMYLVAVSITIRFNVKIIHARGHAAAQVGLFLKRLIGCQLIFDFRGLWVDERVDKGGWNLGNLFDRLQYLYYKRVEYNSLYHADHIVVLTNAVVDEVLRQGVNSRKKITVIPCCADFDHFVLADATTRKVTRTELSFPLDSFVLGYLGSVGGMYRSDRFFRFVEIAVSVNNNVRVLALTPDVARFNSDMLHYLPLTLHPLVHVRSANLKEVAKWLKAMDVLVSFFSSSYARIATSPTKLAESFAAGVPTICNYGVGDVTTPLQELDAGVIVDADSDTDLRDVANCLVTVASKGGVRLRQVAREKLGLELAIARYRNVYLNLEASC